MSFRKSSKQNELVARLVTGIKAPCVFCSQEVDDEIIYGKLYAIGDIQCHYFCVLLASCLVQKGKDEEGLFGFLYKDILAEVERSKKHKCSYCNRGGATLGCSVTQCRKQFHLPCGRERNAISLFYGNYKSFCQTHAPKQKITSDITANVQARRKNASRKIKSLTKDDSVNNETETDAEFVCAICYEEVQAFPTLQTFWPPCCARDAWFHRSCLQRMALSAGIHYLKCPLCNDKDNFHEAVLNQGYYIPDRDAAWELEQNAFAEIYERSLSCSAGECKCPMGRNHDADNGAWEIRACLLCGSTGAHAQCLADESEPEAAYACVTCRPAAPDDLDSLAKTVQAVILSEENRNGEQPRRGPVMPSRMSLRRTKTNLRNTPSRSTDNTHCTYNEVSVTDNVITSRRDLNLKTPRKPPQSSTETAVMKIIDNKLFSPIKLLEQGFREKISRTGLDFELDEEILEDIRRKFKKPRPLSEKRKIVNAIVSGVFDNMLKEPKQKEAIKEWCSPKKIHDVIEEINEETRESQIQAESTVTQNVSGVDTSSLLLDGYKEESQISIPEKEIGLPEQIVGDSDVKSQIFQELSELITEESDCSPGAALNDMQNLKIINTEKDTSFKTPPDDSTNDQVVKIDEIQIQQEVSTIPTVDDVNTVSLSVDDDISKNEINSPEKALTMPLEDNSDDSCSTFQLPPEFIAEESNDSLPPVFNTPKKLKTFDIQKDSSLEISENDHQIVNIDVVKMESNSENIENIKPKSPFQIKKCTLKSNPLDKKTLKNQDIGIDMECFKNYYLNEVDKEFKINSTNNITNKDSVVSDNVEKNEVEKRSVKRRRRIKEVNCKKRKMADGELARELRCRRKPNSQKEQVQLTFKSENNRRKRRYREKKIKIKLSISDVNIPVRIKWKRKQQLRLKISGVKKNKRNKKKMLTDNKSTLKQYILNPMQSSSDEIIVKPEKEVSPPKRKYVKHEKFSDNLVQTSLRNFFTVKSPEERHAT